VGGIFLLGLHPLSEVNRSLTVAARYGIAPYSMMFDFSLFIVSERAGSLGGRDGNN
jgi:hypothetical protein